MKVINHIYISQISCSCLICHIRWVFQRKIPDWHSFKLCIPSIYSPVMLMIKLRETGCQLTRSWTWCSNQYYLSLSFNIWISTISFFTYNCINICRISFCISMNICFNLVPFQSCHKFIHCRLILIQSYYNRIDGKTHLL